MDKLRTFIKGINIATNSIKTERDKRLLLNIKVSALSKIVSLIVPFISIRLTYDYLSPDLFGIWNTVVSFFAFFTFSDFGLGSGLQTHLSKANGLGSQNESNKIVNSTFIILCLISVILFCILIGALNFVNWATLFNVNTEITHYLIPYLVLVICVSKIINIPFSVVERVQNALQVGYLMEIATVVSNIFTLILVYIVVRLNLGAMVLFVSLSFAPVVIMVFNFFIYFKKSKATFKFKFEYFDREITSTLLQIGLLFSILSILISIMLSMDIFIVARTSSLENAGFFSILVKLSNVVAVLISVMSAPLWGAFGEAISKKDFNWIKLRMKRTSLKMTFLTSGICLVGLLFAEKVTKIWLGETFIFHLLPFFFLMLQQILLSFLSPYFMYLNAAGHVRFQLIIFLIFTVLIFPLKYNISKYVGFEYLPVISAIGYFLFVLLPTVIYVNRNLNLNMKSLST